MRRKGNLWEQVCSIENLILAEKKARKGKTKQPGVIKFDENLEDNLINLRHILLRGEYKTSKYTVFIIRDPKVREIYRLPYYPDRIVHHALMNVLKPIFISTFTSNTYSCIEGRGIHKAMYSVVEALKDEVGTKYCLKLDVKKFYPSIDPEILKILLQKKFKDEKLLELLYEIIDSAPGQPIGNYLSQFFANFYLTYFDHWIKEELGVKHYWRYCDDVVILASNKEYLHDLRTRITEYLATNLKLEVKSNYQVFSVAIRGLDFLGYKFYPKYRLLRKSIKQRFIRMIKCNNNKKSLAAYNGWLVHANCINLRNKYT